MQLKLILDTGGAPTGIDREALVNNIQAELDKFAKAVRAQPPKRTSEPVPEGAQGVISIIHWFIQVLTDPAMAPAYAKTLVYALNDILLAIRLSKKSAQNEQHDPKDEKPQIKLSISKIELILPAATATIKKFLESLGDN